MIRGNDGFEFRDDQGVGFWDFVHFNDQAAPVVGDGSIGNRGRLLCHRLETVGDRLKLLDVIALPLDKSAEVRGDQREKPWLWLIIGHNVAVQCEGGSIMAAEIGSYRPLRCFVWG